MNIVVCVKQTPVATAEKQLDKALLLDRENTDNAMNTYDEVAVEAALRLQEADGGSVTVLSLGPEESADSVRKALAMGADRGVVVSDDAARGSDVWATSLILAAALRELAADLVLLGLRSDDAGTGVLAAALAAQLGLPLLSNAQWIEVAANRVRIQRRLRDGFAVQECALPLVLSVTDAIFAPRYPSLKGIMSAKRKPLETWSLARLGIDASQAGLSGSLTRPLSAVVPAQRAKGEVIEDHGDAAERIAAFLAARKVI